MQAPTLSAAPRGPMAPRMGLPIAQPAAAVPNLLGPRMSLPQDPSTTLTVGGGVLSESMARAAAQPVALNIMAKQAPAVVEEWTDGGQITFRAAVRAKRWNKEERRFEADRVARCLDVLKNSGLDLNREPGAEVLCRDLVAAWYLDQKKDQATADLLRESSQATEGLPRATLMEAMSYRKLQRGAGCE